MAGGPSPSSTSPPNVSTSSFLHGSYGSTTSSSPNPPFSSQSMMATDVFAGTTGGLSHNYNLSPIGERKPIEKSTSSLLPFSELEPTISNPEAQPYYTIFMRKLPRSTGNEALRSMLLFAKDLIDVEFVPFDVPEDKGYNAAVARFKTLAGAHEARDRLHGKPNTANDAKMIVEVLPASGSPGTLGARRNTVDGSASRQGSTSTASSAGPANRQTSRYGVTFQTLEKMSPPNGTPGLGNGDFPVSVSNKAFSGIFSPQSPIGGNAFDERSRNVGKSVINDDAGDDDELLKDPVAYARSGQSAQGSMPRRTTNPQIPVSRFGNLTLSTTSGNSITSPQLPNYASPRSVAPIQSPSSALSAISPHTIPSAMGGMGPTNHQITPQYYQRYNYPPVNPADQHPPCNTLYVGNLPLDTSEDELKAMFSKQRGYKRLCFRTKPNGPMCFVEFEDISFATKALNELYGHPLHNSVKGGIRLSFSKNPLGVRGGQNNSGPQTPLTPQSAMPGMGAGLGAPPGFSTATGPPPGLAPPGLAAPMSMSGASNFGVYANGGFGMASNGVNSPIRDPMRDHMRTPNLTGGLSTTVGGTNYNGMGGAYSEYMMGR